MNVGLASAGFALWCGYRAVTAADLLYLPVPALGFFRADVALLVLAIGAVALRLCWRPYLTPALAAAAVVLVPHLPMPRYYLSWPEKHDLRSFYALGRLNVTVTPDVLPLALCGKLLDHTWAARQNWTHISDTGFLGGFSWGASTNFDRGGTAASAAPWGWSLKYGVAYWQGRETIDALLPSKGSHRQHVQAELASRVWPKLRGAYAAHLGAPADRIHFGGETAAGTPSGLRHFSGPSVQIYLANAFFAAMVNPHTDLTYANEFVRRFDFSDWQTKEENGTGCELNSVTSLLIPLSTPPGGTGLLWWGPHHEDPTLPVEYEARYKTGSVYSFPSGTLHSISPWAYNELGVGVEHERQHRVTIQAFGIRCGEHWLLIH